MKDISVRFGQQVDPKQIQSECFQNSPDPES